jgi:formimidoylglutamate deiminase
VNRALTRPVQLPGFVNAHSHAFQRALRGSAEGADFWEWRELMLREAERHTAETVRRSYAHVYAEMRRAGYTAVGEFHYLGLEEARAAADAAHEAGIELVLLYVAYSRGGIARFRQDSVADYFRDLEQLRDAGIRVAVAPHSVRACPPDWLEELGRYAGGEGLPLHVHADEQPREIHATHADGAELDLVAQAGARICACPTTEANLGDGFLPVEHLCERTIGICIGSDSNVRIDPLEELRELEGVARRQAGRRNIISVESLLCFGTDEGAASLGLETWPDVELDLSHPQLDGVDEADAFAALVFSCSAEVFGAK